MFVVALTRVARKIDSHIEKIGLNPAQTGNGIGSRLPGVMTAVAVRTMGSLVSRSMANAKGGSGGKSGRNGNTGRGGTASRHSGNPRPNNPVSGGSYNGGSSVNNTGTATSVNSGTHINGSSSSTNIGGNTTNTEKHTGQAVRSNANVPKPNNAPNVSGAVKSGGTAVNQGVQNGGQQGAVHENVQNKGSVQRPPIPRNTAGGHKNGNNPMSSVVNGGNVNSANPTTPNNRVGNPNVSGANKGNSIKVGKAPVNVPSAVSGNVKSNVNHSTQNGGGKTTVSTDVVNNRSNIKTATQNGGSISGQSKSTVNVGGNNGSVNVSGGSSGGNNIN